MKTWVMLISIGSSCVASTVAFFWLGDVLRRTTLKQLRHSSVMEVSNKIISLVNACFLSAAGFVIVWQTPRELYSHHPWPVPCLTISTGYMFYDTWCMYYTFWTKQEELVGVSNECLVKRIWIFVRARWLMLLHHAFFIHLALVYFMGAGIGDKLSYKTGVMFLQDVSTIFVHIHAILIEIGAKGSTVFILNGVLMAITYFVFRIYAVPAALVWYARHLNIPVYLVPFHLPTTCLFSVALVYGMSLYWFGMIMKGICKAINRKLD